MSKKYNRRCDCNWGEACHRIKKTLMEAGDEYDIMTTQTIITGIDESAIEACDKYLNSISNSNVASQKKPPRALYKLKLREAAKRYCNVQLKHSSDIYLNNHHWNIGLLIYNKNLKENMSTPLDRNTANAFGIFHFTDRLIPSDPNIFVKIPNVPKNEIGNICKSIEMKKAQKVFKNKIEYFNVIVKIKLDGKFLR